MCFFFRRTPQTDGEKRDEFEYPRNFDQVVTPIPEFQRYLLKTIAELSVIAEWKHLSFSMTSKYFPDTQTAGLSNGKYFTEILVYIYNRSGSDEITPAGRIREKLLGCVKLHFQIFKLSVQKMQSI